MLPPLVVGYNTALRPVLPSRIKEDGELKTPDEFAREFGPACQASYNQLFGDNPSEWISAERQFTWIKNNCDPKLLPQQYDSSLARCHVGHIYKEIGRGIFAFNASIFGFIALGGVSFARLQGKLTTREALLTLGIASFLLSVGGYVVGMLDGSSSVVEKSKFDRSYQKDCGDFKIR
ncbi:MAG: hypothetical protein HY539_00435 [Deltaproteobacteria bacterium]|nr:hypothetical protein [Deltaproteobacteria bacterium]